MSKDTEDPIVSSLHESNYKQKKQYYMGANIDFEAVVPTTKHIFHQHMIESLIGYS